MGVATAVAIGSLAVSAGSTAMSFVQAGQQKKAQRAAEVKATEAMAEARKKLEINYAEQLSIQKEPYELEREAMLSQGALAMQAGVESDRGAEVSAGKIQMAQNAGQAAIRGAMGQELMGIESQIINEDSRLRDLGVQLDLGEVEGAQLAARDAQEASAQAMQEGFQGVSDTLGQGLGMVNLYQKQKPPKGGASGGSPGTQINSSAPKYSGSSFNPMDTASNPLGYQSQFTGSNGVISQKFNGTFNPNTQSMFPQYDAFGNIIRR